MTLSEESNSARNSNGGGDEIASADESPLSADTNNMKISSQKSISGHPPYPQAQAPPTPTPSTSYGTPSRGQNAPGTPPPSSSTKYLAAGSRSTPGNNYAAPQTPIASAKRPRSYKANSPSVPPPLSSSQRTPSRVPPPSSKGAAQFSPMHPPTSFRLQVQHRIADDKQHKQHPEEDNKDKSSGTSKLGVLFSPLLNLWKGSEDDCKDSVMKSPSPPMLKPKSSSMTSSAIGAYMDFDEDGDLKMLSNGLTVSRQQSLLYGDASLHLTSANMDKKVMDPHVRFPSQKSEYADSPRLEIVQEVNLGQDSLPEVVSTQVTEEESPSSGADTDINRVDTHCTSVSLTAPAPKSVPPAEVNQAPSEDSHDSEEYEDEFNPYLFIKNLPPYESIRSPWCDHSQMIHYERMNMVPKWSIPPKATNAPPITLVLDLDETLVHCTVDKIDDADLIFPVLFGGVEYKVHVRLRPHLEQFLKSVSQQFEVIIFTASQRVYANELLNRIDPQGRYIRHRMYRESCLPVEGNYLKDLNVLGTSRSLAQMVLVDNSPHAFGYQVDNGIPIESWYDDPNDRELLKLEEFLRTLHGACDVRPLVRAKFQSYRLIANA